MRIINKHIVFYLALCLLAACSANREKMNASGIIRHLDNQTSGYIQALEYGDLRYEIKLKTPDYMVARELSQGVITKSEADKRKIELGKYVNFTLRIKHRKGKDALMGTSATESEYHAKNMYYSYEFAKDLFLVSDHDSSAVTFYQFINYQGLSPFSDVEFAFDKNTSGALNENVVIAIRDRSSGAFPRFVFKKELLQQSPELDI